MRRTRCLRRFALNLGTYRSSFQTKMGQKNKCARCRDLSHVYAIAPTSGDWVKIGVATSIRSRLATGQSFHIEELKIVGYKECSKREAYNLERGLHRQFRRQKIGYSREMFDNSVIAELKEVLNQRDDQYIENMCRGCACRSVDGTQWCEVHRRSNPNPRRARGPRTVKENPSQEKMEFEFDE